MQRRHYSSATSHRDRGAVPIKQDRARQLRRAKTPAERVLWRELRGRKLHGVKFRDQHIVAGLLVDFDAPAFHLAVELDGGVHARTREYDAERTHRLELLGVRVVRFSNADVMNDLARVLATVLAALELPRRRR